MGASKNEQASEPRRRPRFLRSWLLGLTALSLAAFYFYYQHQQGQEGLLNTYYFRTLKEASAEFDARLNQLLSLHEHDQGRASIQANFPSYVCDSEKPICRESASGYEVTIRGDHVKLRPAGAELEWNDYLPTVNIDDVLPAPTGGFAAYLLVQSDNTVLGATGGRQALSIVNTRDISTRIWQEKGRDWLALATSKTGPETDQELPLPGYSYEIDLEVASGQARVFVYPFTASPKLKFGADDENGEAATALHLVGIAPEHLLERKENRRWQLGLLLLALTALGFLWTMLRLLMLSSNQPLSGTFYAVALFFSYSLFVLSSALLFSWGEQRAEVEHKHLLARQLMGDIQSNFQTELGQVLDRLDGFRKYYLDILDSLDSRAASAEAASGAETWICDEDSAFDAAPIFDQHPALSARLANLPSNVLAGGIALRDGSRWQALYPADCYKRFDVALETTSAEPQEVDAASDSGPVTSPVPGDAPMMNPGTYVAQKASPTSDVGLINVYGPGVQFLSADNFEQWFDPGRAKPGNLLNVFVMDSSGDQMLPVVYFMENPKEPTRYNLAHRDYFKKVRDHQGWNRSSSVGQWATSNFYIQRLLNLTSGTRGTTLGMPLVDRAASTGYETEHGELVLGSDIVLASLSMTEWRRYRLLDMTPMVVDQRNGDVLFHLDDDRSMIENLFHAGRGTDAISRSLRQDRGTTEPHRGYYHGEPGWFHAVSLPPTPWSLVVFVPAASTDSYMTNLFLVNIASMGGALLLIGLLLLLLRRSLDAGRLKLGPGTTLAVDLRRLMLFASVFVAAIHLGYWLGSALERSLGADAVVDPSLALSLAAMLICLTWGMIEHERDYRGLLESDRNRVGARQSAMVLLALFLVIGCLVVGYLHRVGKQPIAGLQWYYSGHNTLYAARLHKERLELEQMALSRYPISITHHRVPPLELLPISDGWRDRLVENDTVILPDDVGTFSELTKNTRPAEWVERYLLAGGRGSGRDVDEEEFPRQGPEWSYYLLVAGYFLLLSMLWVWFYRHVLCTRLFGAPGLLRHLNNIVQRNASQTVHPLDETLILDLEGEPPGGENLALVLKNACRSKTSDPPSGGIGYLAFLCPVLERAAESDNPFPGVNIRIEGPEDRQTVELWDVEGAVTRARERASLLQLINELKSLKTAGKIGRLKLYLEIHTLERLLLKSNRLVAASADEESLGSGEYSAWADCLMDFRVCLPEHLLVQADRAFIERECRQFPALRKLTGAIGDKSRVFQGPQVNERRWFNLRDWQKTPAEWAAINAIILSAGALYRRKWESCSTAEKLALYHLALHKRINPGNTEMLEQLALEGLIVVRRGRIRIINNSFAYFVRYAEDAETLGQLVESGEAGPWRDYRLPVTLLVLVMLGAIAVTSGNSLYVIAASLIGLLGTLGTLTNSARLIQENLSR